MRGAYLLRRLGLLLLVLWTAATINFLLPRISPRNPVRERMMQQLAVGGYLQDKFDEYIKSWEQKFGLDQPVWKQYLNYLADYARLDLGQSFAYFPRPVMGLIGDALPWTIGLVGMSLVIAFTLGTLLGALIAWPRSPTFLKYLLAPLMMISSVPFYLVGLILIYFLAFQAKILPLGGAQDPGVVPRLSLSYIGQIVSHSILPALSMILASLGGWALGMRGMMVTVQGEDYMILAKAKGLNRLRLFFTYGIRNALLPQVTGLALSLGYVASGSVLVETIFGYPGVGGLLSQAIRQFDYPTIYGIVFIVILGIGLATLLLDLLYPLLDPRIRYGES